MREREEGWFSPYTSHVIGADFRRSTWTHNESQLGFTLLNQTGFKI
jgi:hypothetical protein